MFNEYDEVRLREGVQSPESFLSMARPVTAQDRGIIVHVYPANPPVYIVEFFDSEGQTVDVVDVKGSDLTSYAN